MVNNTVTKHPNLPPLGRKLVSGNRGLTQAYLIRDLTALEALKLKDLPREEGETNASRAQAICALVRAWSDAVTHIRIFKGRPLPGSLRPDPKPKKSSKFLPPPSESMPS